MVVNTLRRFVGIAALSISFLQGCGAESNVAAPAAAVNLAPFAPSAPDGAQFPGKWLYTAQLYGEDLTVYRRDGLSLTYVETLKAGLSSPQGTVTTPGGWWYVANGGHSNVLVYRSTHNGPRGPINTLDDYGQIPSNVDVTPSRRLVAVSNASTGSGGGGSVSVYLDRQTEPARTLTYGDRSLQGTGVAIDHRGDCYWSFNDPATASGAVVEFARCNGKGRLVVPAIAHSAGLAFDQRDDLYYVDQGGAYSGIYKCKRTSKCALFATGFGLPVNINFDLKHKYLWVADATGYIDAVDPKSGKIVFSTQSFGGSSDPPIGIAPAPGG